MSEDHKICSSEKCSISKGLNMKDGSLLCEIHCDNLKCVNCKRPSSGAFERDTKNHLPRILCQKCFNKQEAVQFAYKVCYYGRGDTCLSKQSAGSIFCSKHDGLDLCSLCKHYRTKDDVTEYEDLGLKEYCGTCAEKIHSTFLQKSKVSKKLRSKVKTRHIKRREGIISSRKYKTKKAKEARSDSESDSEDDAIESEHDSDSGEADLPEDEHPDDAIGPGFDNKVDDESEDD